MMQTDVKMVTVGAGTVTFPIIGRTRIKAVALTYTVSGGAITLADTTSGVTLFSFTPAAAAGSLYMLFPGEGILFEGGVSATTGSGTSATVFYG